MKIDDQYIKAPGQDSRGCEAAGGIVRRGEILPRGSLLEGIMGIKNSFFKKGDICELKEWTNLILMNESTLKEIENGEMGPQWEKMLITGRPAYEAIMYVARRIVEALQSKIATWEKLLESMPEVSSVENR